jgi:uncharacterized protein (DUF1800 family)
MMMPPDAVPAVLPGWVATPASLALNRYGLGARPDDAAPADPRAFLLAQFERYQAQSAPWADQPGTLDLAAAFADAREQIRAADQQHDAAAKQAAEQALRVAARDAYRSAVNRRLVSGLTTPAPFVERLTYFWSNHFAISVEKPEVAGLAGAFELEAIRPHVLGRFEDMLMAVEHHPAMLLFLDQARSVGPDSINAIRAMHRHPDLQIGLNENLGREIMELHTLGVRSGYTQADVTEFARALTGWSIARPGGEDGVAAGSFFFRDALHEPGARTVLGRRYAGDGEAQASAILRDFAASPATADHLAFKLARHFIADDPPPAVVRRLSDAYRRSGGDLPTVYRALLDAPEAWAPPAAKFKSPWEWSVSALRALGRDDLDWTRGDKRPGQHQGQSQSQAAPLLTQLGEPIWRPGSPAGYDDIAASWAAPDALVRRVEAAQRFAAHAGEGLDPRVLARTVFAGAVSQQTADAVGRAESVPTALALLLVSPDFQRR